MKQLEYALNGRYAKNKLTNKVEKQIWVNFFNLDPSDSDVIKQKYRAIESKKNGPGNISMVTNNPTIERNPRNIAIKGALEYLRSTGRYEVPSWDTFVEEMCGAEKDIMTQADVKKIDQSTDKLWAKFMEEIKDPQTQQLLKSMGMYTLTQDAYGWQYSYRNIMRVRAQKPDATFVQTRTQWRNKFGRKVLPNATPIGVQVPFGSTSDSSSRDSEMKSLGYDKSISFGDLTQQQKDRVDIGARLRDAKYFTNIVFYDISDTVLIDPNGPDKWAEEAGFDNNLTAHINAKAIEDEARRGKISKEEANKLYHNEQGDVKLLATALATAIQESGLKVSTALPQQDNESAYQECFIKMVAWTADALIEKYCKIVKADNRKQGCAVATTIVLCLCKVAPERVAHGLNNGDLTEQSYYELKNVINKITEMIRQVLKKNGKITESINLFEMEIGHLDSVDQLLAMMGMTIDDVRKDDVQMESSKQKKVMKEEFNSMLNRMREADERKWK